MIKRLLISQFILLVILAMLNIYVYLYVGLEPPVDPEKYCDTAKDLSHDCIADLPGRFARGATPSVSLVFFVLFPVFYFCVELIVKAMMPIKSKFAK